MVVSITEVLNQWNTIGIFSYVLPFLIIFAATFGILSKIEIFKENRAVDTIIAFAIGLLALQLDFIPIFFREIFPRYAMAVAILLVFVILVGFFIANDEAKKYFKDYAWVGIVVAVAVILWSLSAWQWGGDNFGIGSWFEDNFWAIVIAIVIGVVIWTIVKKPTNTTTTTSSDRRLKFDLQKIGVSKSGLNIYKFRYRNSPCKAYTGVVAQELLNTQFKNAVVKNGKFFSVDYSKIDVPFRRV